MHCIKCGVELSENSKFCNSCGTLQQPKENVTFDKKTTKNNNNATRYKKIGCLVIVALFLWVIFVFGFVLLNDESSDSNNSSGSGYSATEAATESVIEISASKLIKAYQENEINASKNFKGKYLKVTGYVDQFSRTDNTFMNDGYYVYIDYGNNYDFNTISCMLREEYVDDAANLKQGDKITIIGRCEGFSGICVDMYDCEIVK